MTIRICDSFDVYTVDADLAKKWLSPDASWTFVSNGGRFGGGCIRNAGAAAGKTISTRFALNLVNDYQLGFYFRASAIPGASTTIVTLQDSGSGFAGSIQINTTTGFVATFNYSGSLAITGSINVCDGNWHWIEHRIIAGGTAFLYVDNISQGSGSGGVLGGKVIDHFVFSSIAGITMDIDDFYGAESNVPVFPLNARQITVVRPASDGVVGFGTVVGGTGSHASAVNEHTPDGDTSYVQDSGATTQDLYNMSALGIVPTGITGVMVNLYVENPTGGTINVQAICKSGAAAQSNATAQAVPLIYQTQQFIYLTDPNTSAAWTIAGLNAAQFGFKNA